MSSKSGKASTKAAEPADRALQKKQDIPVQITDLSVFDDNFANLRERFIAEMKRVEDEMLRFSTNLSRFYNQPVTMQTGVTTDSTDTQAHWEEITTSPLVHGEGENRTLKLQFDVSQFTPEEVNVKLLNNILSVSATHEEKSESTVSVKQYNQEFLLPPGTTTESVVSSLSRDGVLVVQVPLPPAAVKSSAVQKATT